MPTQGPFLDRGSLAGDAKSSSCYLSLKRPWKAKIFLDLIDQQSRKRALKEYPVGKCTLLQGDTVVYFACTPIPTA